MTMPTIQVFELGDEDPKFASAYDDDGQEIICWGPGGNPVAGAAVTVTIQVAPSFPPQRLAMTLRKIAAELEDPIRASLFLWRPTPHNTDAKE